MARASRKKRKPREERPEKEKIDIENAIFDRQTLLNISSLMRAGVLDSVESWVAEGKEAVILRGKKGENDVAVKAFKLETSSFRDRQAYLEKEIKFKNKKEEVIHFARREFKALSIASQFCHAPKVYGMKGNVIVMDFIGEEGKPYPRLKDAPYLTEQKAGLITNELKELKRNGVVHADVSEYNLLNCPDALYLIDFGQAVFKRHPKFEEYYNRDLESLQRIFSRYLKQGKIT
ncbi:MAG: RIO1 family regulatory kinase/ATPase [Candidatus Anstonellales archaeon]